MDLDGSAWHSSETCGLQYGKNKEAEELEALGHWGCMSQGSPENTRAPNTLPAHSPSKSGDYKDLVKARFSKATGKKQLRPVLSPSPSSLGRSLEMWLEEASTQDGDTANSGWPREADWLMS